MRAAAVARAERERGLTEVQDVEGAPGSPEEAIC